MRKILLTTTLLLGLVLLAQAENPSVESHLLRGYDYLDKGQADDAIIEFMEVLAIDSNNLKAIEGIEKARSLGREPARKVIAVAPPPGESAEKVEKVEKLEPPREESELPYWNVLTLLSILPLIIFTFALILIYRKRIKNILNRYNLLLTYQRKSGYLAEDRDLVKMLATLYKEEEIFDSTSALTYERAGMFFEAGLSYENSKNFERAAEMYEKKSSTEGDDYDILQRLAQIYHDLGQGETMANILKRMVTLREDLNDLKILGELCHKLKDIEGSISAYEKLSRVDRERTEYQDRLLELYYENGYKEKFLMLAEEVSGETELSLDNLSRMARTYVEKSNFYMASQIYRKLTEKRQEYRYELIETLVMQDRIDEALEECQRLPLTNSQEANNLLNLYGKISESHPDNGQVKYLIEEIYRKAEANQLEIKLLTKDNERGQIFRPPIINAQEPYTILTENSPEKSDSDH